MGRDKAVHGDEVAGDKFTGDKVAGDKIGRDKISVDNISDSKGIAIGSGARATVTETTQHGLGGDQLAILFAPLLELIEKEALAESKAEAVEKAQTLRTEVARGKQANDKTMGTLIQDLVKLVPKTVAAIGTAFGGPLLAGVAGPVTQFVLEQVGARTSENE